MHSRNLRDIAAGGAMIAFGLWFASYALSHYGRGTLARVGEGAFPAGAGFALAFFGLLTFFGGMAARPRTTTKFRVKAPFFIVLGTASFALVIQPFGLVPAIVLVTVLSSFADLKARFVSLVILCAVLSLMAYLVFRLGLGLLIPMLDWPF